MSNELPEKITIDVYRNGSIECTMLHENGAELNTFGSTDIFVDIASSALRSSKEYVKFNKGIPSGLVGFSVAGEGIYKVCVAVEAMSFPFTYKDSSMEDVVHIMTHYPPMIFFHNVDRGRHVSSYVFALKESYEPGKENALYQFPYGNVGVDGHVCWGNVNSILLDSVKFNMTDKLHTVFSASTFNGHLSAGEDVFALAKQCENEFDYEILKPVNKSLSDLLDRLL